MQFNYEVGTPICSICQTQTKRLNQIQICTACRQVTDKESKEHTKARQEFFASLFHEDSKGRPLYDELPKFTGIIG